MKSEKEKIHKVEWRLDTTKIVFNEKQVKGVFSMPRNVPNSYKGRLAGQPVKLDVHTTKSDNSPVKEKKSDDFVHTTKSVNSPVKEKKSDDFQNIIHSLTIMRDSCSQNILKAELVFKQKSEVLAWVEPYTGNLLDYLVEKKLGIQDYRSRRSKFTLPTPNLDSALSQVFQGLGDLWKSGKCHGGFSLAKTYYVMEPSGIKIKLANFRKAEGTFKDNLVQDCTAAKDGLSEILEIATNLLVEFPNLDCCQLNGLIAVLRDIAPFNAESAFEIIKRQPFFWGQNERKEFFIFEIPLAWSKEGFSSKVNNAEFITLPWGNNDFGGLLSEMNSYRSKKGLGPYDTGSREGFVKFISGLYTHEADLQSGISVDETVQRKHPGLCYRLYAFLPHANSTGT